MQRPGLKYAVLPGVDVRRHACSHPDRLIQLLSPKKTYQEQAFPQRCYRSRLRTLSRTKELPPCTHMVPHDVCSAARARTHSCSTPFTTKLSSDIALPRSVPGELIAPPPRRTIAIRRSTTGRALCVASPVYESMSNRPKSIPEYMVSRIPSGRGPRAMCDTTPMTDRRTSCRAPSAPACSPLPCMLQWEVVMSRCAQACR